MKKILFLVLLLLFKFNFLFSGELIFGWNKVNEAGGIQDMKFMPDNNMFIVLAGEAGGSQVQIRSSETGDIISTYPIQFASFAKVEFTPDSTRFFITNGKFDKLELYNISNMQLIKSYQTLNDTMPLWFSNIAVDPHRPFIYATTYGEKGPNNGYIFRGQVSVYNYETMELVSHLTPFDGTIYNCLSVSRDGRYLAAISEGKSYLRVWDLNTMKLIREFQLYDPYCQDCWCKPQDMKFSEINTDNIYFTGNFLNHEIKPNDGIFKYNIVDNDIEDSTLNDIVGGKIQLFDNENRIIQVNGESIKVIYTPSIVMELSIGVSLQRPFVHNIIYSPKYDQFIGNYKEYFASTTYDRKTSNVDIKNNFGDIIYPNPTNGIVSIELPTGSFISSYQITNYEGKLFDLQYKFDGISKYSFDFTTIPSGAYLIKLLVGNEQLTYKVIKE